MPENPSGDKAAAATARGALHGGSRDAAARQRAVESNASLLVRAPAGSGKTELLIRRFLRLLAEVEEPEAILALTFSRKAAAEMRQRLLQALTAQQWQPHQQETRALAEKVRQRDAERGWNLSQSPSRLRVMTFDSLALSLLQATPWRARSHAPLHPTDDADRLYRMASEATLARAEAAAGTPGREAAQALLRHLDADMDGCVAALCPLLARRDQWITWLIAARSGGLRQRVEADLAAAVARALHHIAAELRRTGLPGTQLPADTDLASWRDLMKLCLTDSGKLRAKPLHALSEAQCTLLYEVRGLPGVEDIGPQWEAIDALLELLPLAVAELQVVFAEQGECDFTEITFAACDSLGGPEAPSGLAFALDARLQHLLVDEFQDTSHAQHQMLERLLSDWSPGDTRTLFVVGDAMQSIYGFRNADVSGFLNTVRRRRLGPVELETVELECNFRSQPPLVDWCNRHFRAADPAPSDDSLTTAVSALPEAGNPVVEVHALPGQNRTTEAVCVANLVEAELEAGAGCVAILVQSRGHLRDIVPELQRRGIRFRGKELWKLRESPVVLDLLALGRALLDPADRVAALALLRAPWCGLTLADLHTLCVAEERDARQSAAAWRSPERQLADPAGDRSPHTERPAGATRAKSGEPLTIHELWEERQSRLSEDGRRRAAPVLALLARAAAEAGRRPLGELIAWCWRELGGEAAILPGMPVSDAEAFFRRLETVELEGPLRDWRQLDTALDRLYSAPDTGDGIQVEIMTAHQAKGLQFDVVILPGLDREPPIGAAPLLRWLETGEGDEKIFLAAPRPAAAGGSDLLYQYLGEQQQRELDREQLRLLYVAATRAQRRLHLLAFDPKAHGNGEHSPRKRSPLARLWPTLEAEFQRQRLSVQNPPDAAQDALSQQVEAAEDPNAVPQLRRRREPLPLPAPGEIHAAAARRIDTRHPAAGNRRQLGGALSASGRILPAIEARTPSDVFRGPQAAGGLGLRRERPGQKVASHAERHLGTAVHLLLQIAAESGGSLDAAWLASGSLGQRLRVAGVPAAELAAASLHARQALETMAGDPRGRWILAPHAEAHCEWALSGVLDAEPVQRIVDRSFVENGVRWVIDYKLAVPASGEDRQAFFERQAALYQEQLAGYARLLQQWNPTPVRCGLYFPRIAGWWPVVSG